MMNLNHGFNIQSCQSSRHHMSPVKRSSLGHNGSTEVKDEDGIEKQASLFSHLIDKGIYGVSVERSIRVSGTSNVSSPLIVIIANSLCLLSSSMASASPRSLCMHRHISTFQICSADDGRVLALHCPLAEEGTVLIQSTGHITASMIWRSTCAGD